MESCQQTIPEAITAFLEGEKLTDGIMASCGDCDTLAAIAGSMAEGFYGVPEEPKFQCRSRPDAPLLDILQQFSQQIS